MSVKARMMSPDAFNRRVAPAINAGLTRAAMALQAAVVRGFGMGARFVASAPGSPPNVQRGALRRGVLVRPAVNLRAAVISTARYSRIHERGGVIRPTRGRYLPVPLNAEARRMRERVGSGSLRGVGGMFVVRSRRGNLLLARAAAGGITPMFALKPSVRLPPRPFMAPAARRAKSDMKRAFVAGARAVLTRGGRR